MVGEPYKGLAELEENRMNDPQLFTGIYVAHWEIARFVIKTGKRFFGLLPKIEAWQLRFPEGYQLPESQATHNRRCPPEYFRMTVRGTLGPKGNFGHKGICSRQLNVLEVVSCEKIERPARRSVNSLLK